MRRKPCLCFGPQSIPKLCLKPYTHALKETALAFYVAAPASRWVWTPLNCSSSVLPFRSLHKPSPTLSILVVTGSFI